MKTSLHHIKVLKIDLKTDYKTQSFAFLNKADKGNRDFYNKIER